MSGDVLSKSSLNARKAFVPDDALDKADRIVLICVRIDDDDDDDVEIAVTVAIVLVIDF